MVIQGFRNACRLIADRNVIYFPLLMRARLNSETCGAMTPTHVTCADDIENIW